MHKQLLFSLALIACISVAHQCFGMDKQMVVYQGDKTDTTNSQHGIYLHNDIIELILNRLDIKELPNVQFINQQWYENVNSPHQVPLLLTNPNCHTMMGVKRYHHINRSLLQAVEYGDSIEVAKILKSGYANPNYQADPSSDDAFHTAIIKLDLDITRLLKNAGAKPIFFTCAALIEGLNRDPKNEIHKKKYREVSNYLAAELNCETKPNKHYAQMHCVV